MASSLINKPVNPKSYFLLEFALPSVCTFLPILTIPSIGYGQTGLFFFFATLSTRPVSRSRLLTVDFETNAL